jgi:peptide-methionine (S)-S-oxide reductase
MNRKNNRTLYLFTFIVSTFVFISCNGQEKGTSNINTKSKSDKMENMNLEVATLGAGCFWCIEAVFQELKGVEKVESGYMGGHTVNPTYKAICTGTTGHAEVAKVTYDPEVISFTEILEVFFTVHDPTTLNRQGADAGTQYRSAIFYHTESQKKTASEVKSALDASGAWYQPIVTEINEASKFYIAEDYHQNYNENNPNQGYCVAVVRPKLEKFRKVFKDKLKK